MEKVEGNSLTFNLKGKKKQTLKLSVFSYTILKYVNCNNKMWEGAEVKV